MLEVAYDFMCHYPRKEMELKNAYAVKLVGVQGYVFLFFFQLGGKGKCLSMAFGNSWGF